MTFSVRILPVFLHRRQRRWWRRQINALTIINLFNAQLTGYTPIGEFQRQKNNKKETKVHCEKVLNTSYFVVVGNDRANLSVLSVKIENNFECCCYFSSLDLI